MYVLLKQISLFEERENLKCTASGNKEHKNFIHIRLLHRIFIDK